ncbi:MAG: hypothetical protein U0R50_02265 [Gaiellales bacterium]
MTNRVARARRAVPYLVACVVYIAIGAASPSFMLSWPVAGAYFLGVVWLVPLLVRLARRR